MEQIFHKIFKSGGLATKGIGTYQIQELMKLNRTERVGWRKSGRQGEGAEGAGSGWDVGTSQYLKACRGKKRHGTHWWAGWGVQDWETGPEGWEGRGQGRAGDANAAAAVTGKQ